MRTRNHRPETTLFMIQSLDGRITPGATDNLDVDKDFKRIVGVREGLPQYYELEGKTDRVSFNTGRVMAKVGVNERTGEITKSDVSFVVVDSKPHLTVSGCEYFANRSPAFYLVTANRQHPALSLTERYDNIKILSYDGNIDLPDVFRRLREDYGIQRITIQSGGDLNTALLRLNLIDHVSIVVAPCLIGGRETQSLLGGLSLRTEDDLAHVKALRLTGCDVLQDSYVHLKYDVIPETVVVADPEHD